MKIAVDQLLESHRQESSSDARNLAAIALVERLDGLLGPLKALAERLGRVEQPPVPQVKPEPPGSVHRLYPWIRLGGGEEEEEEDQTAPASGATLSGKGEGTRMKNEGKVVLELTREEAIALYEAMTGSYLTSSKRRLQYRLVLRLERLLEEEKGD